MTYKMETLQQYLFGMKRITAMMRGIGKTKHPKKFSKQLRDLQAEVEHLSVAGDRVKIATDEDLQALHRCQKSLEKARQFARANLARFGRSNTLADPLPVQSLEEMIQRTDENEARHRALLASEPPVNLRSPALEAGAQMVAEAVSGGHGGAMVMNTTVNTLPREWVENDPAPDLGVDFVELYHFTSRYHLPAILKYGIAKGDVPIVPSGGFNSPALTVNPGFVHQTWAVPNGRVDKTEIRLTVHINRQDPALWHWPLLVKEKGMDPTWHEIYVTLGHQHPDYSERWWIYTGRIPVEWIQAIDFKGGKAPVFGIGRS
jgi:hypothetical protein